MTPEEERKAEMTLVLMMHKLPSRQLRRKALEKVGCDWEEYQHLKNKYRRLLERYDLEKEKEKNVLQS